MGEDLTPEEEAVLKELAENLIVMNKIRRSFAAFALWASSIVIALVTLWTFFQSFKGK